MKKAVIYERFANNKPKETVEQEILFCTEFALNHDMEIVKIFVDENQSGMTMKRPELKEMLKTIKSGIDCVIVYEMSQLTRNIDDWWKLEEKFKANNVEFWAAKGGISHEKSCNLCAIFKRKTNGTIN